MRNKTNKYKAIKFTTKHWTSPTSGIFGIWCTFAALGLYFASDIKLAAENNTPLNSSFIIKSSQALFFISNTAGINTFIKDSSLSLHTVYDNNVRFGDRFPPKEWQDNEALGISEQIEALYPEDCQNEIKEPSTPKNILIVGSSSMYGTMGVSLEKHLKEDTNLEVVRHAKSGTGLARPDVYNWFEKSEALAQSHKADLVIAQFIGNDCQGLVNPDKTLHTRLRDENWAEAYYERVEAFIQLHQARGANVVMIGMPIVRSKRFQSRLATANAIVKEVALENDAHYISIWEATANSNGQFVSQFKKSGKQFKFRSDDGIHLSYNGAKYVAEFIFDELQSIYPWGEELVPSLDTIVDLNAEHQSEDIIYSTSVITESFSEDTGQLSIGN